MTTLSSLIDKVYAACPELLLRSADKSVVISRSPIHLEHVLKTLELNTSNPNMILPYETSDDKPFDYDISKSFYAQTDEHLTTINNLI